MAAVQQAKIEPRTGLVRFDGFMSYSHTADELLAPRLQAALQTFAKPWWKRRAVRVFRDQSSLSANPHLWSSITAALDASDWFILLTSPEAAASTWVDREVAYWREQKDPERIIPVLTDGTLSWDETSGRLDPNSSVPPSLVDAFNGEPRWVDLRWAEEETQLDLRNGRFRAVVADIASSLRGIPKDDLESEEVRQHRRTRRTAWGAGIALAVLAVAAVTGAVIAVDQRDQAEAQRVLAEGETVRAESAESLARSRELAASAINLLDDNPELSILLGLEAIESTPSGVEQPVEAINALREATHASRLRSREAASPSGGFVALDLSSDGTRLATVAYLEGKVTVTDVASGREISSYTDSTTVDHFFSPSFSADGALLAVGVADSSRNRFTLGLPIIRRPGSETPDDLPPRVIVLQAETGEVLRTIDYPSCGEALPRPRFSPDGAWLAVAGLYGPDCRDDQLAVELLDADTLQLVHRWETTADQAPSWTADGSRLAVGSLGSSISGTVVFDVATREAVLQHPGDFGILSPDGQLLVVEVGLGSLDVIEVATGTRVDILTGFGGIVLNRAFTADSSRLMVGTGERESLVFDLESGKLVHRLSPTGVPISFDCAARCETLFQSNLDGEVLTWDLSTTAGGEINTVDTGYFVNADSVATAGDIGVFLGFSFFDARSSDVVPFNRASGQISTDRRPTGTNKPIPLPDGRIVLLEVSENTGEFGPVVVWDPSTGSVEEVAGCWTTLEAVEASGFGFAAIPCADREGDYFLMEGAFLSPDQSSLLIADPLGNVKRFDARTLAEQTMPSLPTATVQGYGGTWLLSYDGEDANVVDLSDGRVVATLQGGSSHIARTDVSANGDSVALFNIDSGELTVYDTGTWQPITSFFPGATRGISFSPDGSKILTAQNDGYVRIWDTRTGTELFRIPLPGASDGYWLDETHIVIGAATGLWTTITLDIDELKDLAVSRLTRSFTAEECEIYRIDPCPSLETITSR